MTGPWLGAVADDLTGACDLADAVSEQGESAIVVVGTPGGPPPACGCAVVALKSRTAPRAEAVGDSLTAARWLVEAGCTTIYQKYCSTFDSTDEGNIGPVADALVQLATAGRAGPAGGAPSVGTPATPRVGRTLYQGQLFVGRQLLSESPLRDHPLTPMRDSDLVRVLSRQTRATVALVDWNTVAAGPERIHAAIDAARRTGAGHVLVDALTETDLDNLATALLRAPTGDAPLVAGGAAGLAAALARVRGGGTPSPGLNRAAARAVPAVPNGRRLILSGSCSARTREQVARFTGPLVSLSPVDLDADFGQTVDAVLAAVAEAYRTTDDPVLVSSSADPVLVARYDSQLGPGRSAELLEAAAGEIAARAIATLGVRRLLTAGGETAGAVVRALGLGVLRVGPAVGPGLPWMVPDPDPKLAILFKSGNFGEPDLFHTAWKLAP
ncbi:four-carbon acid sugar kinase family protein [Plantactinospora mayteni]|uniref:3-oxo-tetronate kinase n=1 Tax=Plantactinospora mayteni TaxID=566021 RepID=A0ABQ4F171_9ACTN|nr:3-oxo-tetronate kinase [Plantactinospora mayteni]GIH00649.1 HPr kinase [Plantactinospora mayteni]